MWRKSAVVIPFLLLIVAFASISAEITSEGVGKQKSALGDLLNHNKGSEGYNYESDEDYHQEEDDESYEEADCSRENYEHRECGPSCDVYCDHQPAKRRSGKLGGSSSRRKRCGENNSIHSLIQSYSERKITLERSKITSLLHEKYGGTSCNQGCFCIPGYARYGGRCIHLDNCPREPCNGPNEIYRICGPVCIRSCRNYHVFDEDVESCFSDQCVKGCYCQYGYVRNRKGECVTTSEC